MGSGPRYGLVGTGLGRLSFYYQCLSCGRDCRSWHNATCVGTGGIPTILGTPSESKAIVALLQPGGGNTPGTGVSTV